MDQEKIAKGFRLVLEGLGLDMNDPHLKETPARTALAWTEEICKGLQEKNFTLEKFPLEENESMLKGNSALVALGEIPVKSLCAHHLLPFIGEAWVAYLPDGEFCGLSALSRVVDHHARRPQMQEILTQEIAHTLNDSLKPKGVAVLVKASHYCMGLRGVNHEGTMATSVFLGDFRDDAAMRAEFLALVSGGENP